MTTIYISIKFIYIYKIIIK